MTILATTMGTAFLIVLASVGFGLHETIREGILSNGVVTEIQVHSSEVDSEWVDSQKKKEHVKAVVHRQYFALENETLWKGERSAPPLVVTDFQEEAKVGFDLLDGRLPENEQEVVVGYHFANQFNFSEEQENQPHSELLGQFIQFYVTNGEERIEDNGIMFTIVGIAKKPSRDWMVDSNIYADASSLSSFDRYHISTEQDEEEPLFYGNVNVYADELKYVKSVSEALKKEGYSIYSVADELETIDVFFFALKAGLVFVGTIAILIASIGIFNTMTMAVTERTREIGIMKAIGVSPKLIQRLFLMESAWIGVVGTLLAIALSYAVSAIANLVLPMIVGAALKEENFTDLQVTFSLIHWQLIVIASVLGIGVAMLSGWRPARKATKINVLQALRQEI